MNELELKKYRNRLLVCDLILEVLEEKKTVQEALALFPLDKEDINIKCAFDALLYREADEDLRINVSNYAKTQDEYLKFIANTLKKNQKLPKNVIQKYLKYNKDNLIGDYDKSFKNCLAQIKRFIHF